MRRAWLVVLLLLPAAAASEAYEHEMVFDTFLEIDMNDVTYVAACEGGRFENTAAHFRFLEETDETIATLYGSSGATGCGVASIDLPIPQDADHVHVRFNASRTVGPLPPGQAIIQFDQLLHIAADGVALNTTVLFPPDQSSVAMMTLDPAQTQLDGQRTLAVRWEFADRATAPGESWQTPHVSGAVRDAFIEFSGMPIKNGVVEDVVTRSGDRLVTERFMTTRVTPAQLEDGLVEIHGRVPPTFQARGIIAPDGTEFTELGTRSAKGIQGYDWDRLLVENKDGYNEMVVSLGVVERFGSGTYVLVFQQVETAGIDAANVFLVGGVLATPLAFGTPALIGSINFRKRAVGDYVRISRTLLNTVGLLIILYLLLLSYVFLAGRVRLLAVNPADPEALFLFAQIVLLVVAFFALWRLRLRYVVGEMEANLERERGLQTRLRESNRDLEMFASAASHDLREPLRMVASYTDLLERRYSDKLGEDAREFMGYMRSGTNRMQTLIGDLLAYSRIDRPDTPPKPTSLNALMDILRTDLKEIIRQRGAKVTNDDLPTVDAHPALLRDLLQNLVQNGIKFCKRKVPKVHVSARVIGNKVRVEVTDNGIGIEPKFLQAVFEPFRRLHSKDEYPGAGIGLATCKKIIEIHNGTMGATSVAGKGSTFWFELPN